MARGQSLKVFGDDVMAGVPSVPRRKSPEEIRGLVYALKGAARESMKGVPKAEIDGRLQPFIDRALEYWLSVGDGRTEDHFNAWLTNKRQVARDSVKRNDPTKELGTQGCLISLHKGSKRVSSSVFLPKDLPSLAPGCMF
jgi:hypothetical protein